MKKTKKFDCVKMMRNLRNKVQEDFKDYNTDDFIEFLNKKYPDYSKKKNVLQGSKK